MRFLKLLRVCILDEITDVSVPNFEPPNCDQEKATRAAIGGKFTMIQGPPGTTCIFSAGWLGWFTNVFVY